MIKRAAAARLPVAVDPGEVSVDDAILAFEHRLAVDDALALRRLDVQPQLAPVPAMGMRAVQPGALLGRSQTADRFVQAKIDVVPPAGFLDRADRPDVL